MELAYEDENDEISNKDRVHNLITLNVGVHLILVEVPFFDGISKLSDTVQACILISSLQGFRTTSELSFQPLGRVSTVCSQ
jgi:hypothetical protein